MVEKWDQAAGVMHRCGNCGVLWDQDQNAAINLLARGNAMGKEDVGTGIRPGIWRRNLATSRHPGEEAAIESMALCLLGGLVAETVGR
jgi:hypothetical protein